MPEDQLRNDAKIKIRDFVVDRFLRNVETKLQDVQDVFGNPPYDLGEGTVISYLNELVSKRKLSTWKVKNLRFYGPPKIPLPIKFGIGVSAVILCISMLIDNFFPAEVIYDYVYIGLKKVEVNPQPQSPMLPLVVYLLVLTFVFTLVWWLHDRKLYK